MRFPFSGSTSPPSVSAATTGLKPNIACMLVMIASLLGATPTFASPQEFGATLEDFEEVGVPSQGKRVYSPFAGRNYPNQVLFGDMHFHTDLSFDAGLIGTRLDVDDGYRFPTPRGCRPPTDAAASAGYSEPSRYDLWNGILGYHIGSACS